MKKSYFTKLSSGCSLWLLIVMTGCCILHAAITSAEPQRFSDTEVHLETLAYRLALRIDYEHKGIHGHCRLTVLNSSDKQIHNIPLILYPLLKVTSVKNEQAAGLSFSQRVLPFEDRKKMKVNYIDISTASPIAPGEERTISIRYEGQILGYVEAGHTYVKDRVRRDFTIIRPDCTAYPQIGYPSVKSFYKTFLKALRKGFDYSLEVTVPKDLVVANGGKLVSKTYKNNVVTYAYENIKPAWRIDACVAKYNILEDNEKKLKVFYRGENKEGAKRVLNTLIQSMELYTNWFGPLKDYRGYAVIEVPAGYGSQVDVTCILQEADAFTGDMYGLYHETSHLWNPGPLEDLSCRFESEGLANFLQFLVAEKLQNEKGLLEKGLKKMRKEFHRRCKRNPKYKNVPMADYGKEDLTEASYSKGMIAFYVLYRLVGEENFIDIIRAFYQRYGQSGATLEDFVKIAKEKSKADLTKFFEEWLYGTESSKYVLNGLSIEDMAAKYQQSK